MEFTGERFLPGMINDSKLEVEHLQRYNSITHLIRDKVVLDAACGEGYGSAILSDFAKKVIGLDLSEEAIIGAKDKYNKDNLSFVNSSIDSLPFEDESIDVVVSFETIEHVEEEIQNAFLREIKRVLKKNGTLIMSTPNKHIYSELANYNNEFHKKEFYEEEFFSFLSGKFSYVKFFHQGYKICSIIEGRSSNLDVMLTGKNYTPSGKYIIAVCSDETIEDINLNTVVLDTAEKYEDLIARIIQLQDEVEERNKHIHYLDEHIGQLCEHIKHRDTIIAENKEKLNQTKTNRFNSLFKKIQ